MVDIGNIQIGRREMHTYIYTHKYSPLVHGGGAVGDLAAGEEDEG